MLLCVLSSFVLKSESEETPNSINIEKAGNAPSPAPQQQQAPPAASDSVAQTPAK